MADPIYTVWTITARVKLEDVTMTSNHAEALWRPCWDIGCSGVSGWHSVGLLGWVAPACQRLVAVGLT